MQEVLNTQALAVVLNPGWFCPPGGGTIGNVWRQFFHNPGVRVLLAIQGVGVGVVKAQDGPEQAVYLPPKASSAQG